jgi:hypothetical protein
MKKIDRVAIGTIAMVACLLFCTPALANYNFDGYPVVTRTSGIVDGGVFIDYLPWDGQTTLTGNFNVPTGNVIWARLYAGIWGGKPIYEGWVNVTFNDVDDSNGLGPIHLQGQNDTNANVWCSGSGKHWIYYDVTDLVNSGAANTATTTKINATVGSFDGRVYGIVLVVVYKGGDDPKNIQYWINDGSDGLNDQKNDGTSLASYPYQALMQARSIQRRLRAGKPLVSIVCSQHAFSTGHTTTTTLKVWQTVMEM